MVDRGLSVALDFDHGCGLIGSFERQSGEAQRKFILGELDFLASLEQPCGEDLGLEAAEGDDRLRLKEAEPLGRGSMSGPVLLMDVEGIAAAGVVGVGIPAEKSPRSAP